MNRLTPSPGGGHHTDDLAQVLIGANGPGQLGIGWVEQRGEALEDGLLDDTIVAKEDGSNDATVLPSSR